MKYQDLVNQLTPEMHASFKRALELGHWPDGREMSAEQRQHCMQAVIAYDEIHKPEDQRVGFIDRGHKAGQQCDDELSETLRWTETENPQPQQDTDPREDT
ncbi:MAG: DUF1315 family protein [Halieaceae bacterium]